jgi:hypothetical protein
MGRLTAIRGAVQPGVTKLSFAMLAFSLDAPDDHEADGTIGF